MEPLIGFIANFRSSINICYIPYSTLSLPESIPDNLNALLLGGGILATIRTIEKKLNVVDNDLQSNTKIYTLIIKMNKYWRPALAYIIIAAVFYLYIIILIESACLRITNVNLIVPSFMYGHIKDLLITGGFLAGLKTAEKNMGISDIH